MNLPIIQDLAHSKSYRDFVVRHKHKYAFLQLSENPVLDMRAMFFQTHLNYDFEFWAASCVKIKPKRGETSFLSNLTIRKGYCFMNLTR